MIIKRIIFIFPSVIILLTFFAIGLRAQTLPDLKFQDSLYFDSYLEEVYVSTDGKHLATRSNYGLFVRDSEYYKKKRPDLTASYIKYWDMETGMPLRLEQTGFKESMPIGYANVVLWAGAYTARGEMLEFRTMPKYDTATWDVGQAYKLNTTNHQILYLKDNLTVAVFITSSGTIQFYDLSTGLLKKEVSIPIEYIEKTQLVYIDDDYLFYYSNLELVAVDLKTSQIIYKAICSSFHDLLFFEHKYIFTLDNEGTLLKSDFMSGKALTAVKVKNGFFSQGGTLSISEDGKYLSVFIDNNKGQDFVSVYTLHDLSLYYEYDLHPNPSFATFGNNSQYLFVLTYSHGLNKIDIQTKKWVLNIGVKSGKPD